MSLTETKTIDKIEIVESGVIQIREATSILRDGEVVAKTFHRWSLSPGQDLTGQPDNIKAIAEITWTEEVVNAYNSLMSQAPHITG